jgi:putative transposase
MDDAQSLSHTKWECKYHIVWIPKCRRKVLFGKLREHLGTLFRELARRRECEVLCQRSGKVYHLRSGENGPP